MSRQNRSRRETVDHDPDRYTRPVHTIVTGRNEARSLFSDIGPDRRFWAAVRLARSLSRASSVVEMPETVVLPTDRPSIIVANHSSLFDLVAALVVLGHFGIPARIGVNARFFTNPAGGAFLRGIGCIPFAKGQGEIAERQMIDDLLAGKSAALMPEGRITRPQDQVNGVGPGRPGISRIARSSGAAIVPVGFAFCDQTWPPGTAFPKPRLGRHKVIASIGPPIALDSDDHVANAQIVMDAIGDLVTHGRRTGSVRGPNDP